MTTDSIPSPVDFDHNVYSPICALKTQLFERLPGAGSGQEMLLCGQRTAFEFPPRDAASVCVERALLKGGGGGGEGSLWCAPGNAFSEASALFVFFGQRKFPCLGVPILQPAWPVLLGGNRKLVESDRLGGSDAFRFF